MKRVLTPAELKLIELAKSYSSQKEFERKNKGKYLVARSKNLLKAAFPEKQEEIPRLQLPSLKKGVKGVYILYAEETIIYIGKSLLNCETKIRNHLTDGLEPTRCEVYEIEHVPDIYVLETYLIQLHQPSLNKVKSTGALTISISNLKELLGTPTVTSWEDYKQPKRTWHNARIEDKVEQSQLNQQQASSNIRDYFNSNHKD